MLEIIMISVKMIILTAKVFVLVVQITVAFQHCYVLGVSEYEIPTVNCTRLHPLGHSWLMFVGGENLS